MISVEFEWSTYWSAVNAIGAVIGAVFTTIGALTIIYARRELRFSGWLKAQEVFTNPEFTQARAELFKRIERPNDPWTPSQRSNAFCVCRRMEELAALSTYFPKQTILREWGPSIAKAWFILEPLVREEREKTKWNEKWHAFEKLGKAALRKRPEIRHKELAIPSQDFKHPREPNDFLRI